MVNGLCTHPVAIPQQNGHSLFALGGDTPIFKSDEQHLQIIWSVSVIPQTAAALLRRARSRDIIISYETGTFGR
jgi:hypothetical protein